MVAIVGCPTRASSDRSPVPMTKPPSLLAISIKICVRSRALNSRRSRHAHFILPNIGKMLTYGRGDGYFTQFTTYCALECVRSVVPKTRHSYRNDPRDQKPYQIKRALSPIKQASNRSHRHSYAACRARVSQTTKANHVPESVVRLRSAEHVSRVIWHKGMGVDKACELSFPSKFDMDIAISSSEHLD